MATLPRLSLQFVILLISLVVLLALHALQLIYISLGSATVNFQASLVRDEEEYRFAETLTILNARRIAKGRQAFQYVGGSQLIDRHPFGALDPAPGLTFSILAANRWTHEIDDYEPSYLLESTVNLLLAMEKDLSLHGTRFGFINVTLCPTTDKLDRFSELVMVSRLLPKEVIKKRLRPMNSYSLNCRTLLDVASCLTQSVSPTSQNSYIILLEDDLIADRKLLQRIWDMLSQFHLEMQSNIPNLGAVVLYKNNAFFGYSLLDTHSVVELCLLSSAFTILIISIVLPRWYRRLFSPLALTTIPLALIVSALFVSLIGRARWIGWFLALSHKTYLLYPAGQNPTPEEASALLIPVHIAQKLGTYLDRSNCSGHEDSDHFGLKSKVVFDFLRSHSLQIYTAWPPLFQHRGLYSIYKNDIHNPLTMN